MSEKVDPDFVAFINRSDNTVVQRYLRSGISDQRKAFLLEVLQRREAGAPPIPARTEALSKYQASRSVADVRESVAFQQQKRAAQVQTSQPEKTNVPFGYYDKQVLDIYSRYQKELPEKERRKMSQYEINQRITTNPNYQAEIQKIYAATPEETFRRSAEVRGYTRPEQYGRPSERLSGSNKISSLPQLDVGSVQISDKQFQNLSESESQQFSGRVEESFQGTPQATRYYVRGEEVGKVTYDAQGQPTAQVLQRARLTFPEDERGTVQSIILGDEGIDLMEQTQAPNMSLQTQSVSDVTAFPMLDVDNTIQGETSLRDKWGFLPNLLDYSFGAMGKKYVGIGGSVAPPLIPSMEDLTIKRVLGMKSGEAYVKSSDIKSYVINNSDIISKVISSSLYNRFKPNPIQETTRAFAIRVGAEAIPTTPGDVALYGATYGLGRAGWIGKSIVGFAGGILGVQGVLSKSTTPEQKVFSGLIAMGGGASLYYATPIPRRLELYSQIKSYASKLPEQDRILFYQTLKEAKSLRGISPNIKPLDLSRLTILENKPQAQKAVVDFFAQNKKLIVGGSISQPPQLETGIGGTKRPGDIDVYVRSLINEQGKTQQYAVELAKILRQNQVQAYARAGKINVAGEKFVEFHPYKSFLRPNIEQVTPIYYPARAGITKTPEGVSILRLDIQAPRKVIGYYLEPIISGKNRLKDLPAYKTIKTSLLKTQEKQPPQLFSYGTITYTKDLYSNKAMFKLSDTKVFDGGRGKGKGIKISAKDYPSFEFDYKPSNYVPYRPFSPKLITYYPSRPSRRTGYPSKKEISFYTPLDTKTPKAPPYTPIITPTKISPPKTPPYFPTVTKQPPTIPPYPPSIPRTPKVPVKQPPKRFYWFGKSSSSKTLGGFNVFVRRWGRFNPVGVNLSLGKAYSLGLETTQKGLGQTFKLEKYGGGAVSILTPKGYYQKPTKEGILYIEKPKSKINVFSEKSLLGQLSKQAKQSKKYSKQKGRRKRK